jgi:hypothetical protein
MERRRSIPLLIIAWVVLFPPRAMAYLDPGTGSLVVQSLIAALAAVGFGVRLYWSRIRQLFGRSNNTSEPKAESHTEN